MADIIELQRSLGYTFSDIRLLDEALTHSTYADEYGVPSNQRLEFLGDAVLELCVSRRLYERDRTIDEGILTKWRAQLVCEKSLAMCARGLALGRYLKIAGSAYSDHIAERQSVLCDLMESVLGAIYLDGGLEPAAKLVDRILGGGMLQPPEFPDDYKSRLQIYAQERGLALTYSELDETGPDHAKQFTYECDCGGVRAQGTGTTKKGAQQAAAHEVLKLSGV